MSELVLLLEHVAQLYNERSQLMYAITKEHLEPYYQNAALDLLKTVNEDIMTSLQRVNALKLKARGMDEQGKEE